MTAEERYDAELIAESTSSLSTHASGDFAFSGQAFADNLLQPRDFTLSVSMNVAQTTMSVDELTSLSVLDSDGQRDAGKR